MTCALYNAAQNAAESPNQGSGDHFLASSSRVVLQQTEDAIDWTCGKLSECGRWMLEGAYFQIRDVLFGAELLYRLHGADREVRHYYIDFGIRDFVPADRIPGYQLSPKHSVDVYRKAATGQGAYEEELWRQPLYPDSTPRPPWEALRESVRRSWSHAPRQRVHFDLSPFLSHACEHAPDLLLAARMIERMRDEGSLSDGGFARPVAGRLSPRETRRTVLPSVSKAWGIRSARPFQSIHVLAERGSSLQRGLRNVKRGFAPRSNAWRRHRFEHCATVSS